MISVIIPTLNAGQTLPRTLAPLVRAVVDGLVREVVVVDGGSADDTLDVAEDAGARLVRSERGRGLQLRAGCAAARGDWLLTLHADTRLSADWPAAAAGHVERRPGQAGYFRFRLDDPSRTARLWEAGVALRCATLGGPYGDQGLLVSRRLYDEVGQYPPWPLMEDVEMVRRLGRRRLIPLAADAVTSAERYQRDGYVRRSLRNWALLARWRMGAAPDVLARAYRSGD